MRLRPTGLGGSYWARIGSILAQSSSGTRQIVGNGGGFVSRFRLDIADLLYGSNALDVIIPQDRDFEIIS